MLVFKNNRVLPEVVGILCGFSQNQQCIESTLENPHFLNQLIIQSRNLYQQQPLPSVVNHTLSAVFQGLKNNLTSSLNVLMCQLFIVKNSVKATSDCCIEFQV
jgi:hypothetical protein